MKPISQRKKKTPPRPGVYVKIIDDTRITLPKNVVEELMEKADVKEPITLPKVDSQVMPLPRLVFDKDKVLEVVFKVSFEDLPPHRLRRKELSAIHGIPEKDIFVDPGNGVELYRTITGGWAYSPGY